MTLEQIIEQGYENVEKLMISYIMENYGFNKTQANMVYGYAYENNHSWSVSDVVYAADEVASLVADAIKAI